MLPERQITYLYTELGSRIKNYREILGIKQAPFAELLHISRASLVNIERGRQHPPLHNLYQIARILNVTLADLLPDNIESAETPATDKLEKLAQEESGGDIDIKEKLLNLIKHSYPKKNE